MVSFLCVFLAIVAVAFLAFFALFMLSDCVYLARLHETSFMHELKRNYGPLITKRFWVGE